ncbi:hypothetical protein Tco_0678687 [Tanacetum coccineum]|uniref:Uncharacterized protein n=1 Tax=Tanacetum coccineum TaxID=301880 RepID=A0ABQ4XFR6_9ASTR
MLTVRRKGFLSKKKKCGREEVGNKDDNDLNVDVKVRFTEWEEEERKGDEMDLMVVRKEGGVESSGRVGVEMVGEWPKVWWLVEKCWKVGERKSSDTPYPLVGYDVSNLLPRQPIDLCSLNNVFVLPNNMAYSVRSIRRTALQQIYTAYSNKLNTAYLSSDTVAVKIFAFDFLFYVFSSLREHPTDNLCLFSGNRLTKKGITMVEPNEYISVTRKNFLSNDNEGRVTEKSFVEIQGTFLVKIHDNTFNGIIRENAFNHINNFLKIVGPLKVKGLTQDQFRLSVFPVSLAGETKMESDEDDDPDDIDEIFMIDGNLFNYETPLCKAFNDFNYLLKIDTDLFAFDIQGIKTYEEYELNNNMTGDLEEPCSDNGVPYQLCDHICEPYRFKNGKTKWPTCSSYIDGFYNGGELPGMVRVRCMTDFQDHKWYDELTDGKLKEEALTHKSKVKESWGDATPGVMKLYAWLKNSFENFHELDHDVLGLYANAKTEKDYDPYLEINRIIVRNYGANNAGNTQDNQGHEEHRDNPTHDPSVCKIRRFKMMKYSFNV